MSIIRKKIHIKLVENFVRSFFNIFVVTFIPSSWIFWAITQKRKRFFRKLRNGKVLSCINQDDFVNVRLGVKLFNSKKIICPVNSNRITCAQANYNASVPCSNSTNITSFTFDISDAFFFPARNVESYCGIEDSLKNILIHGKLFLKNGHPVYMLFGKSTCPEIEDSINTDTN